MAASVRRSTTTLRPPLQRVISRSGAARWAACRHGVCMNGGESPLRLTELLDRLRPHSHGLVLHDPDGPAESLVHAGELVATPAASASVAAFTRSG